MQQPIPPIIHLLAKDKRPEALPEAFYRALKRLHPEWEICIYDDEAMDTFMSMHFPDYYGVFLQYPYHIQRLDVFRLLVLYQLGGFYLDTDMICNKPLDNLLEHSMVLAIEKILTDDEMQLPHHKYAVRIANYMIGSSPRYPFLLAFAETALSKIHLPIITENDILETTGPGLLTNFYHEQKYNFTDIHLLKNETAYCLKRCCSQPSCHFGDYAAHLHQGSWRWQYSTLS